MREAKEKRRAAGRGIRLGRALLFMLCLAAVFWGCQHVLSYKHTPKEYLTGRFQTYQTLPADTVDVLFVGASMTADGVSPNVLWNEAGIASYNLSGAAHQYTFCEQKLLAALELNTKPKYAVFMPTSLYRHVVYPQETITAYRKLTASLPRWSQRVRAVRALERDMDEQGQPLDTLAFALPLLTYHEKWQSVRAEDFLPARAYAEGDPAYMLGQTFSDEAEDITYGVNVPSENGGELDELGMRVWRRIFALCHELGVTPVVVQTPYFVMHPNAMQMEAARAFFDECGVLLMDYTQPQELARMGWDYTRDFINTTHLNLSGAARLSVDLAQWLSQLPGVEDHRGDARYAAWEESCDTYYSVYEDVLTAALGEEGARRRTR